MTLKTHKHYFPKTLFALSALLLGMWIYPINLSAENKKEISKILFIGNSYTHKIAAPFNALVDASGKKFHIDWITHGGYQLSKHAGKEEVIEKIKNGGYDVVIMQDQSQTPTFPDYLAKHLDSIRKLSDAASESGADIVLYMTWGRKNGDKENHDTFPDDTYQKMQERLKKGYENLADKIGAKIAPVGLAWSKLVDKMELYREDQSHPSAAGALLASCVIFETVFGIDPATVPYHGELDSKTVAMIKKCASETVKEYVKQKKKKLTETGMEIHR